ncbi:MAG: PPC domain-containing protein [Verrucomicrobiota bacterium]|nr:PPC domain-containing protein [Verrucomicrobiota bacterium]
MNSFDGVGSGAADDWTFDAEAGDRLTARIESAIGDARPRLRLINPAGQTIASADGDGSGAAEFFTVLLPLPGAYKVRVYTDTQVSDYRLRADLSRGPTLEAEPNNSVETPNVPPLIFLAGSYRFRMAGSLPDADSAGDFFALGTLDAGNAITSELFTGPQSSLPIGAARVSLFRSGQADPVFSANTNFTFAVVERGEYFVRVSSADTRGLFARYLLTITIADGVLRLRFSPFRCQPKAHGCQT